MLIRQEQMLALSAAAKRNFELQLVGELHEFAPWHAKVLGEAGLMRCVQFATQRAEQYGFTHRGPIRLYLQMVFLLGAHFDTDPLLSWAGDVLLDPSIANQTDRATHLYEALGEYLKSVAGPGNRFAKEALVRAHAELSTLRTDDNPGGGGDFSRIIFEKMQRIYPEKSGYAGDAAVLKSIELGISAAAKHSASSRQAAALFCGLTFALGHGFETDPHLPWIQKTLQDSSLSEDRLVERLRSRVATYLEHVNANVQ